MSTADLARGIRDHRAFGRRSVAAYNRHLSNAVHFACLVDQGHLLIEPLGWALLMARGGDAEEATQGDSHDDGVMREYLDAGWRRIEEGQEDFDILLDALRALCLRRRIALSRRDVPAVFWLAPEDAAEAREEPPGPDRAAVIAAMERVGAEGAPEGFGGAKRWFVRHPDTDAVLPAKAVWALAAGIEPTRDYKTGEALRGLARLDFRLVAADQPAADIAESGASLERLPEGVEAAVRQVTRDIRERDPAARRACERFYRARNEGRLLCEGCGIDFAATYGARGEGFMHFHHIAPLAEAEGPRPVDGPRDLVPLCPNCHAIVHRGEVLLSVAELRGLLGRG